MTNRQELTNAPGVLRRPFGRVRGRATWITGVAVVGVVVALVLPSWLGSWGPLFHIDCASTEVAKTGTFWLPLGLVNSPYGGLASDNATSPMNPSMGYNSSSIYQGVGGTVANGTVWGGFVLEEMVVDRLTNTTQLGPGPNSHCSSEFAYRLQIFPPNIGYEVGSPIFDVPWGPEFGTGQYSDAGEPLMFNFTTSPGNSTSIFHQGFTQANSPPISTCSGPARIVAVRSFGLNTWVPFDWEGVQRLASLNLPIVQIFSYKFPENFGTWEVDNLSTPGGPGGGWAFSYSPCS